jgi:hypothetical protein
MGFLLVAIALVPLSWMASNLWALYLNYQAARTSGLPILICPFDPENVRAFTISSWKALFLIFFRYSI